jgi:metal-responsive CopG/Arc/MetJ family transcriptional regulator
MKRVVVSLPEDMLKAPDKMRTGKLVVVSRSEILTSAIKQFLRDERERELEEQCRQGNLRYPKTEEDGAWLVAAAATVQDVDSWDSGTGR